MALNNTHLAQIDHPDKQHEEYNEDDSSGDAAGDVRELALVATVAAGEGARAAAGRLAARVLHTLAAIVAVVQAHVCNTRLIVLDFK